MRAYKQAQNTGLWPKGFISDEIEIPIHWNYYLLNKISNAWIDHILNGDQ